MNRNPDEFKSIPASLEIGIETVPESVMTALRRCLFGVVINHNISGRDFQFWVNGKTKHLMKKDVLSNVTVDMGEWLYTAGNHTNPNI